MGIDCEFRASSISDVDSVLALPDVHKIYRPGETFSCPEDRWVITTLIKFVGHGDWSGYAPDSRVPRVAALLRSLRLYCTGLEYGGDNGVPFEEVTDAMISEIEQAEELLMSKPLPCPFCGGNAELDRVEHPPRSVDDLVTKFFYRCNSCACCGGWGRSETSALQMWNTRTNV